MVKTEKLKKKLSFSVFKITEKFEKISVHHANLYCPTRNVDQKFIIKYFINNFIQITKKFIKKKLLRNLGGLQKCLVEYIRGHINLI